MKQGIKVVTNIKVEAEPMYNDVPAEKVIHDAIDLAHTVLEELSIYRQRHNLDPMEFECEGDCCAFLDMVGD